MFNVLEMPWDWPVDVNYHEAKAFCCWKGPEYRLPAEAEHHLMRGPQVRTCSFCLVLDRMSDRLVHLRPQLLDGDRRCKI